MTLSGNCEAQAILSSSHAGGEINAIVGTKNHRGWRFTVPVALAVVFLLASSLLISRAKKKRDPSVGRNDIGADRRIFFREQRVETLVFAHFSLQIAPESHDFQPPVLVSRLHRKYSFIPVVLDCAVWSAPVVSDGVSIAFLHGEFWTT